MSRFYRIVVGPETTSPNALSPASNNAGAVWTNQVNGVCDINAQTVEMDLQVTSYDTPSNSGASWVRIWGPTKEQISQASDFEGAPIQVYGGMQAGLPLASLDYNSGQSGMVCSGMVIQAFGNWQGLNQTLDFVIVADNGYTQANPGNFQFLWRKGQQLSSVLTNCLKTAFPNKQVTINISSDLVLPADETIVFSTLEQLATYVRGVTQDIKNDPKYHGVRIVPTGETVNVFDGTTQTEKPTDIRMEDLIGAPTWIDPQTIQFNTVMRADLTISSQITLPKLAGMQAVTSAQSFSNQRAKNTFDGTWTISYIRHVGNSRSPQAQAWITTFQAFSNTALDWQISP